MSFTVTLRPSGITFRVEPDETVLAAAIRQGIGLPYGCRDGACGSCKSRLLEGRVLLGEHQHKALSVEEETCGYTLTCKARALGDLEIEARTVVGAGDYPPRKMPCRVTSIAKPAADVAIVRLQLPANEAFRYRAGQYLEFILEGGVRRSYSMANAPHTQSAAPGAELHIRHMPGGRFTDHVFTRMAARDILRIEGPFGSFFLREDSARPIVLLASGTGFAPIKAIIEQLRFIGSERSAVLYWGCRRRADLYLHDWALQAEAELPWLRYVPVLSEATPEDGWSGRTGFVHTAVMADLPDLSAHQVYACGTPAMVAAAERDFVSRCKLPAEEFYADAFTSELDKHDA
ncbi:MAG TPA: CDP-6-deoxy-delta-3,4-glucoseen reductase [Burkholderiaceae bacterium]|nr:CDP-6-deoxy-delta-3,4-glucoseen reductase [Burkholderiaceae bacterium]